MTVEFLRPENSSSSLDEYNYTVSYVRDRISHSINFCVHPPTPKVRKLQPASSLGGFVERMWAYATIRRLLEKEKIQKTENGTKRALELSLKVL